MFVLSVPERAPRERMVREAQNEARELPAVDFEQPWGWN